MSEPHKSLKAILELAASGTVGVALLLGGAAPAAAAQQPSPTDTAQNGRVSERLAAIREAVSQVSRAEAEAPAANRLEGLRLAWHNWRNGGWHHPWGNWGWGHPWGNYGYTAPWNNWNNWRNGWNNWRNRW